MKKFFKILFCLVILFFLIITLDMTRINKNFINKPIIEISKYNINSSFLKTVYNKFDHLTTIHKFNESISQKQFNPFYNEKRFISLNSEKYLLKSDSKRFKSYANKKNIFNNNNWTRSHGNNQSNRFSYLDQINKSNVKNIEKKWEISFPKKYERDIQCNPIIKNGIIYFPTNSGSILAIDGKTGSTKWLRNGFSRYVARRGILISEENFLYFPDNKNLISLKALNGQFNDQFGKNGIVKLTGSSSVAPVIYKNIILTVTFDKTIEAFDINTGKNLWNFSFEDPKNNKKIKGKKYFNNGGNPWGGISLDEQRGILFITTGNASSYFDGTQRPGLNQFSNSLIAFDLNKKKVLWNFQEVYHDIWNLDIPAPPILSSISLKNNKKLDVVIAVTKLGNTLIFDRESGEHLFDIYYKKSPASKVFGELTSSHQISQSIPEPFSKNIFNYDQITNINPESKKYISNLIINKKYGFFETYEFNKQNIQFNFHGGAEWPGASVDHNTGVMYVTSNEIPWITGVKIIDKKKNKITSTFKRLKDMEGYPGSKPPWGKITALDLNNGKIKWQKPFGNYEDLNLKNNKDEVIDSGTENFGGVTGSAGGLLFATGTLDSKFYIFDSNNGKKLKEFKLPFIGSTPPSIYETGGKQYILVVSSGSFSLKQGYPKKVSFGNKLIAFGLK